MKAAIFSIVAAAAGLVAAQDFSGQPKCAIPCLEDAIPKAGCKLDDTACQCNPDTQSKLMGLVSGCLLSSCSADDLVKAQKAAVAACAAFAVTGSVTSTSASATVTVITSTLSSSVLNTTSVLPTTISNGTATLTTTKATNGTITTTVPSVTVTRGPSGSSGATTTSALPTTSSPGAAAGAPVIGAAAALLAVVLAL